MMALQNEIITIADHIHLILQILLTGCSACDAIVRAGVLHNKAGRFGLKPPKGGDLMPVTITFHLFGLTFTLRIKWENRHPGR